MTRYLVPVNHNALARPESESKTIRQQHNPPVTADISQETFSAIAAAQGKRINLQVMCPECAIPVEIKIRLSDVTIIN